MSNLIILWIVAGFFVGWMFTNILFNTVKANPPTMYLICSGFIGSLSVYTYLVGMN